MTALTIVDFLNARLKDDENTALAAAELCGCHPAAPVWTHIDDPDNGDRIVIEDDPHGHQVKRKLARKWCRTYQDMFHGKHIARHDPARVLREVAAKRAIMELADEATGLDLTVDNDRRVEPRDEADEPYVGDLILRQLAAVYSDHPDYNSKWSTT
jgi:hypothetical protein